MPYDNEYNQKIANMINSSNEKYLQHLQNISDDGDENAIPRSFFGDMRGGAIVQTNSARKGDIPYGEYAGGAYGSVAGYASGNFRDTGFGTVEGAGKHIKCMGCGVCDGCKRCMNCKGCKGCKGAGHSGGARVVPSDIRTLSSIPFNVPVDDYKVKGGMMSIMPVRDEAMPELGSANLKRAIGGTILGALENVGSAKKKVGRPSKMSGGMLKSEMHSSTMSGFGKSGGAFKLGDLFKSDFWTNLKVDTGSGKPAKLKKMMKINDLLDSEFFKKLKVEGKGNKMKLKKHMKGGFRVGDLFTSDFWNNLNVSDGRGKISVDDSIIMNDLPKMKIKGKGHSGGAKEKKPPSEKQLAARAKFIAMVKAKSAAAKANKK